MVDRHRIEHGENAQCWLYSIEFIACNARNCEFDVVSSFTCATVDCRNFAILYCNIDKIHEATMHGAIMHAID